MRFIMVLILWIGALQAEKLALVIGNSNYTDGAYLTNPIRDAQLLKETLEDLKFKVTYKTNLTKSEMDDAIYQFSKKVTSNDTALFYYSGHGMQYNRTNYLIPLNAHIAKASQLRSMGVNSNTILDGIINAKLAIILLDACRDNPIGTASKGSAKGLAQPKYTQGSYLISYATEIGEIANDGNGNNSPYAIALANNLKKKEPIEIVLRNVRREVRASTTPQQKPYYEPHIDNEVILNSCEEYEIIAPKLTEKTIFVLASESYKKYQWKEEGIIKEIKPKFKKIKKRVKFSDEYFIYNKSYQKIKIPAKYKVIEEIYVEKPININQMPNGINGEIINIPATYKHLKQKLLITPAKLKIKTVSCTQ